PSPFGSRATSVRARGFASPPRDGFAVIDGQPLHRVGSPQTDGPIGQTSRWFGGGPLDGEEPRIADRRLSKRSLEDHASTIGRTTRSPTQLYEAPRSAGSGRGRRG